MLLHAATSLCPAREWNALKAQTGNQQLKKNGPEPTIKVIRGLENCFPTPLIMRLQPVVAESLLVRARGTIPETMRLLNILIRSR